MTCRVESTSGAGGAQMHLERQRHLTGKFGKKFKEPFKNKEDKQLSLQGKSIKSFSNIL
jgi:hypothetical protein